MFFIQENNPRYADIRDIDIANRSWFNHVCMRIFVVVNYIWIQYNARKLR